MAHPIRTVALNTGWLMAERLSRMLIGLLVGAAVARHLGPSSYGVMAFVLASVSIFQAVTSLGLDQILARELPRADADRGQLLGTALVLRLGASLVGWFAACALVMLLRPADPMALQLTMLIAGCMLFQPADLVDQWFQSQSQSKRAVIPRLSAVLVASAVRIALIVLDQPLWTFAAAYLVDTGLAAGLLALSYRGRPCATAWTWRRDTALALLRESWPLLMSGLAIIVYMRIDQLLLSSLVGDHELGLYSAMLPLSQAWHFIATTITASATPFLVRQFAAHDASFDQRFSQLFALLTATGALIAMLVAASSAPLVRLLLGPRFAQASPVLAIHVFSVIPVFLGVAQSAYLTITGRTRSILLQTVAGMVTSVALNLLLIPHWGAMGAATAALFAFTVSGVLCNAVVAPRLFAMQVMPWRQWRNRMPTPPSEPRTG